MPNFYDNSAFFDARCCSLLCHCLPPPRCSSRSQPHKDWGVDDQEGLSVSLILILIVPPSPCQQVLISTRQSRCQNWQSAHCNSNIPLLYVCTLHIYILRLCVCTTKELGRCTTWWKCTTLHCAVGWYWSLLEKAAKPSVSLFLPSPPFSLLTHIINFFSCHIQIASLIDPLCNGWVKIEPALSSLSFNKPHSWAPKRNRQQTRFLSNGLWAATGKDLRK